MTQWNQFTPKEKALAEATFTALSVLDTKDTEAGPGQHVSFSVLYAYATRPDASFSAELETALKKNQKLRETFHRLLEKTAYYYLPRAAAASTGPITVREVEGFRIRLRPSRVEPDQVYVIIELPEGFSFTPETLTVLSASGECNKHNLPAPQGGEMQLLTKADSKLIQGLQDHKTEIFLR